MNLLRPNTQHHLISQRASITLLLQKSTALEYDNEYEK